MLPSIDVTEILLQLSGFGSLSFSRPPDSEKPILSQETASGSRHVLTDLSRVAVDHEYIRKHILDLKRSSSLVIRAVVSEMTRHLRLFVQYVAEVEVMILERHDSLFVDGSISLIKLSTVFTRPGTILAHLRRVTGDLMRANVGSDDYPVSRILERLRSDISTGYDDLKGVTMNLLQTAESVFLLQVKKWCLSGQLLSNHPDDFFITKSDSDRFQLVKIHCPDFIGLAVAKQAFELGETLLKIGYKEHGAQLLKLYSKDHLAEQEAAFASLACPIDSAALSNVLTTVAAMISKHTLRQLLPKKDISELLTLMQAYFLLVNGRFALDLIERADEDFKSMRRAVGHVRDSTIQALLSRTISRLDNAADEADGALDHISATELRMSLRKESELEDQLHFSDLLLGVHAQMKIHLQWPLDIFQNETTQQIYSDVFDYLIVTRRAYERLHSLWRGRRLSHDNLRLTNSTWATAYRICAFLGTLLEYYQAEVIQTFCKDIHSAVDSEETLYDPSELAKKHKTLLLTMSERILMQKHDFGKIMRRLLIAVDQLIATIQQPEAEVAKRCTVLGDLLTRAIAELTMEKDVDALLLRLQIDATPTYR